MNRAGSVAFHPRHRVTLVRGEGVFHTTATSHAFSTGHAREVVAASIDGVRTPNQIAQMLEDALPLPVVFHILSEMAERELVVEGAPNARGSCAGAASRSGHTDAGFLSTGSRMIVTNDYLDPALGEVNADASASGYSWVLVDPSESQPRIGPFFTPGRTGCWACFAHRYRRAHPVEGYLDARRGTAVVLSLPKRLSDAELAALVAGVVARPTPARRPRCETCGRQRASWRGRTPPHANTLLTSVRSQPVPNDAIVEPTVGLTIGIDRLTTIEHELVHVYTSAAIEGSSAHDLVALVTDLQHRAGGSGVSETEAIARTIGEVVERSCVTADGSETRRRGTLAAMGARARHPHCCMLFSDRQHADRREWNARGEAFLRVPEPFNESARHDWTPAWSITRDEECLLPTGLVYRGATTGRIQCLADTNGAAAGQSMADALVRGLLEVVERDAIAIWWYNRIHRPAIDLDSLAAPYCRDLLEAYESFGRSFWVLDITADLGIPTFAAITRRLNCDEPQIMMGFGSDFDGERAVTHAVTEMNQMLAATCDALRHPNALPPTLRAWLREATCENQPYLEPLGIKRLDATDGVLASASASPTALDRCRDVGARAGLEVIAVDLTRPDIDLPVARVFVPGMRPACPRFAPGRLYDVPVALGWRRAALSESELNPIPFFL